MNIKFIKNEKELDAFMQWVKDEGFTVTRPQCPCVSFYVQHGDRLQGSFHTIDQLETLQEVLRGNVREEDAPWTD